jgi:hypothetical protein
MDFPPARLARTSWIYTISKGRLFESNRTEYPSVVSLHDARTRRPGRSHNRVRRQLHTLAVRMARATLQTATGLNTGSFRGAGSLGGRSTASAA